ncbi:MAG: transglycosylase domain-containing protein, partial [Clostridia bacterium]|nr:transglycosylase domain-containing protein [Clostridia bacterium]
TVKNVLGDKKRTPMRKIREMYRALRLESVCTKKEILELYLNAVPLGRNLVGVGAAAEHYFGKRVADLTLCECASLAALTNSPARYDLYRQAEANRARRSLVLREMEKMGYLTKDAREAAEGQVITPIAWQNRAQKVNSWYTEQVITDVIEALKKEKKMSESEASDLLYNGGLKIYTCAVPRIQSHLEDYFEREGLFRADIHAAMTVLSSKTGRLLGIVGKEGKKEGNRLLNCASVKRPPGSAIKPLSVYAPALQEGIINYATVIDDVPVSFQKTKNGLRPWPYNYPRVYAGLTDLPDAIAYSKNTVAVKVFERLGKELSYHYISTKMHVSGIVREGKDEKGRTVTDLAPAPLALGQLTNGATLLDMTAAYGIFLEGNYRKPISFLEVYDGFGRLLLENKPQEERVLSKQNATVMTRLLQSVTSYGTASSIKLTDRIECAGKTGTSSFDRDRWFIGYTPEYIGGILCFCEGEREIGYASPSHIQVWDEIMQQLHKEDAQSSFREAEGVYRMTYCRDSGGYPCEACRLDARGERVRIGYFTESNMPRSVCDRHREFIYDEEGEGIVFDRPFLRGGRRVSLVREEERDFPMQLIVSDAQYIFRELHGAAPSTRENSAFF